LGYAYDAHNSIMHSTDNQHDKRITV